jgi:hypothetical protein
VNVDTATRAHHGRRSAVVIIMAIAEMILHCMIAGAALIA